MSYQALPIPEGVSLGEETFRRSYNLVTKAWYEDGRAIVGFYLFFSVPLFILWWWQYQLSPPFALSVIGLSLYLIGLIADLWSTWQTFRLVPEFERRGLSFPLEEKNIFMKDQPTVREQLVNSSMLFSLGIGVAAWIAPAIGVAGGLVHGAAACSNQRQARRLKVQLRLFDLHRGERNQ